MPLGQLRIHAEIVNHLTPEVDDILNTFLAQATTVQIVITNAYYTYTLDHPDFLPVTDPSVPPLVYDLVISVDYDQFHNKTYKLSKLKVYKDNVLQTVKDY